jgi:hypothetical protein
MRKSRKFGEKARSAKGFHRIDQAAGIAWAITPDGSYFGARANGLEDNLFFFRVVRGKRTITENVCGVTTASRQWHTLTERPPPREEPLGRARRQRSAEARG